MFFFNLLPVFFAFIQSVTSLASQFSWLVLHGLPLFFLLLFNKRKYCGFKAISQQKWLDMTWLYCANYGTALWKSNKSLGPMTRRSCSLHSTFSNKLCCPSCCWGHLISATSHWIQCTHCCFSIDTLVSFSLCLSLHSTCIPACACFKAFCVFSLHCELCTPESLRSAVWSYRYPALYINISFYL